MSASDKHAESTNILRYITHLF